MRCFIITYEYEKIEKVCGINQLLEFANFRFLCAKENEAELLKDFKEHPQTIEEAKKLIETDGYQVFEYYIN